MSCPVDGAVCATYSLWITSLYSRQSSSPESPPPLPPPRTPLADDGSVGLWPKTPGISFGLAAWSLEDAIMPTHVTWPAITALSLSPLLDIHGALWAAKEPW